MTTPSHYIAIAAVGVLTLPAGYCMSADTNAEAPEKVVFSRLGKLGTERTCFGFEYAYGVAGNAEGEERQFLDLHGQARRGSRDEVINVMLQYRSNWRKGDLLPLFGSVYRVASEPQVQLRLELEQMSQNELPKHLRLPTSLMSAPIGGGLRIGDFGIRVRKLIAGEEKGAPQVLLETTKWRGFAKKKSHRVKAGGSLKLGDETYTISRVVLPDPDRQIVGWIELEPDWVPIELEPD